MVSLLLPLTKRGSQGILLPRLDPSGSSVAVAYTDLEKSFETMQRVGPQRWEEILASYDKIVASEVSKIGGEVVKALGDGYLLVFRDSGAAFRCARRLQRRIEERNDAVEDPNRHIPRQRIGLDYGHVTWVERSHGYDVGGHILSRCARVADFAHGGHILITKTFYDLAIFSFPRDEFNKVVVPLGHVSGDFDDVELFEILWRDHHGVQIQPMTLPKPTTLN
jgi:class 3 adenylate cyclase